MAKSILAAVLDGALNYIKNNVTAQSLCSAQPTTRTEAATTFELADVAFGSGDCTLAAGDVSGRKVTFGAKSAVAVDSAGTSTHAALFSATELLAVTTHTSTALAAAGTVDIGAWKFEINNPT